MNSHRNKIFSFMLSTVGTILDALMSSLVFTMVSLSIIAVVGVFVIVEDVDDVAAANTKWN